MLIVSFKIKSFNRLVVYMENWSIADSVGVYQSQYILTSPKLKCKIGIFVK